MKNLLYTILVCSAIFSFSGTSKAQPSISLVQFSTGFTSPVDIANCGDSRLFVVQKAGRIIIVDSTGTRRTTPFLNITSLVSQTGNERGLLGLAFHPKYKQNGYFYVNYTRTSDGATRVSRFSVNPNDSNLALANSEVNLLTISQPFSNHNGGNLEFGADGYLYIGMGDGGSADDPQNNSQNNSSRLGKMLRIDVNSGNPYGIPPDNPNANSNTLPKEIWSKGLRNPWRFSFDRITGDLWIGDVGQNNLEEIDFEPANSTGGLNYGWRCYEGSSPYLTSGCSGASSYTAPVFEYTHSVTSGPGNCSVTGGYVYRGALMSNNFGHYLLTDYCSGRFWWVKQTGTTFSNGVLGTFLSNQYVTMGEDMYGEMYVAGNGNGIIYRITTANPCPVALIMEEDTLHYCAGSVTQLEALRGRGLTYSWTRNGIPANTNIYMLNATQPGDYQVVVSNSAGCSATSQTIHLIEDPSPSLNYTLSNPGPLCEGDSSALNLSGGDFYLYNGNQGLPSSQILTGDFNYYVSAVNSFNCKDSALITLEKFELPDYQITSSLTNNVYCQNGEYFTVSGSGGDGNYIWVTGSAITNGCCEQFNFAGPFQFLDSVGSCLYQSPILVVNEATPSIPTLTGYVATYDNFSEPDTLFANIPGTVISINGNSGNIIQPMSLQQGYNYLEASYTDTNNCTWTFTDSVFMNLNVGIYQNDVHRLQLSPNPLSRGQLLQLSNTRAGFSVWISDITGKVVARKICTEKNSIIDTGTFGDGVYLLHYTGGVTNEIYRFVIQQ